MSKGREIADYLFDIISAVDEIGEFTHGMNYDDFKNDKKTINAVIRSLEVLGEATKHIPPFEKNIRTFPGKTWPECVIFSSMITWELT